jgi:hypothetical protein
MCGVLSIAVATAWAGMAVSSNSNFAFLVFQSTLTDRMPLTLASDASSVEGQPGQCRPVTRNVALVGSAGFGLASLFGWAAAMATAPKTIDAVKWTEFLEWDFIVIPPGLSHIIFRRNERRRVMRQMPENG